MSFMDTAHVVGSLIQSEWGRFQIQQADIFRSAFAHINRYLEFLMMLAKDHRTTCASWYEAEGAERDALDRRMKGENFDLTPYNDRCKDLYVRLQLEVETFYVFAKIVLDKVANAVEFYFGQGRSASLLSHDRF